MKRLSFVILFVIAAAASYGQTLSVGVHNGERMIPYAFIYVNDRPVTVTDKSGIAIISLDYLTEGDIIKASCLGTFPGWIYYDLSVGKKSICEITLHEKFRLGDDISKDAADVPKFFKKNTLIYIDMASVSDARMDAGFWINKSDGNDLGKEYMVNGSVVSEYMFSEIGEQVRFMDVVTEKDTTGLSQEIMGGLAVASEMSSLYPLYMARETPCSAISYDYLGVREGCNLFRIMFRDQRSPNLVSQVLAYIDLESRLPVFVEYEVIDVAAGFKMGSRHSNFIAPDGWFGRRVLLHAADIDFDAEFIDKAGIGVSLHNIVFSPMNMSIVGY